MEEMRDDAPTTATHESETPAEEEAAATAEMSQDASSAIAELNIQEILSHVAKSHSLETQSQGTHSISAPPSRSSHVSKQSKSSFPSHAVSYSPKKKNDEILYRFDSIHITPSVETPISTLDIAESSQQQSRGVLNTLATAMNWTVEGCCISPKSRLEMEEIRDVDVVRTDSMEKKESLIEEEASVEEVSVEEEEASVEEVVSLQEDASVEEEVSDEEESLHKETSVEFHDNGSYEVNKSRSVETDKTEPTKNSEEEDKTTAVLAQEGNAVETTSSNLNDFHNADSVDTDAVDNTSAFLDFPAEATSTPSVESKERCRSPSIDTDGSVTSAEVAAILAAISNSQEETDEAATESLSSPNKSESIEEVRCTSPSTETEGSLISAGVGAILTAIKNESPVNSKEESDDVSIVEEGNQVVSADKCVVDQTKDAEEEAVIADCAGEKSQSKPVVDDQEDVAVIDDQDAVQTDSVPEPSIPDVISKEESSSQTEPVLTIDSTILKTSPEEEVAFPNESVLSPHSEASRITDIASNQTPTESAAKSVRWSMSLGALSSEGDFSPSSADITREESSANMQSSGPTTSASSCSVMESYHQTFGKEGCSSGSLQDLTSSFMAKLKKEWECVETSRLVEIRDDIMSWTESGACFRDTTLMTSPSPVAGDAVQGKNSEVKDVDNVVEESVDRSHAKVDESSPNNSASSVSLNTPAPITVGSQAKGSCPQSLDTTVGSFTETIEQCGSSPIAQATKQFFSQVGTNVSSASESCGNTDKSEAANAIKEQERRTEHLHEEVYKERDYLREWKFNAEESMKCQDAVTGVLRDQKSSLVKQCSELERAIKELKEWKFDINNEVEAKASQIEDLSSQKAELIKQCEKNQQSVEELTQLKMTTDDALAAREADLKQMKLQNSTLAEECREQRSVINDLTQWKVESIDTMKNQLNELESERTKYSDLANLCQEHQGSIHQLTTWKSENEPILESHAEEMRILKDEKSALVSKCDDQQISLDKLTRWKMGAEEELQQNLNKLEMLEKQNSEATVRRVEMIKANEQLTKWKSDAEDTIKKQIKTIDDLTQSKIKAAAQEKDLNSQLELLQEENSKLIRQCDEYKNSIEELTRSKLDAEQLQQKQLAEIDSLKAELAARPNEEDLDTLKELMKWKANAEVALKDKETELNELQTHYLIFGKQCNEQKVLIQQQEDKLNSLTKDKNDMSKQLSLLEKESSKQATKIKAHEDTIQSKSEEVSQLNAEIAQLKENLESDGQPYKEEMLAMKTSHHKELMTLKSERHMLASKIEKLVSKNEDANTRARELRAEFEELKSKYDHEKKGHDQYKTDVKMLEKALKVRCRSVLLCNVHNIDLQLTNILNYAPVTKSSEKKRKLMEKKLASDADFCDILSQRLNEGL